MPGNTAQQPVKLFVYECQGSHYPRTEPEAAGFLGIWPEVPFYYLFFDRPADACVNRWIGTQSGWVLRDTYQLDYEEWQQIPATDQRVGPFILRTGSGDEGKGQAVPDGKLIRLNPGVVFGSGLHATTRGCLLTLANLFEAFPISSVVDLGTGTGILALAAAHLGASRVWALDCNPLAVRIAQKNIRLNAQEERVELVVAQELEIFRKPSDLLVMNIEWPCLQQVLRQPHWRAYPLVVLSGLLHSQWEQLKPLLSASTHRILFRTLLDGWLTLGLSTR